jgi:streptogramin lyase
MRTLLRWSTALALTGLSLNSVTQAAPPDPVKSGDLLIANAEILVKGHAGVLKIDPVSGVQTVISKGGLFAQPDDVAFGLDGNLYIADSSAQAAAGAILRVTLPSRKQQVVTSGGLLGSPERVAVEPDGQLLVTFTGLAAYGVVRVNPQTGAQSYATTSPFQMIAIAVESTGQILVGHNTSPMEILRVDPVTGNQSVVSQGGLLDSVWDIAVAPNGDIIVLERYTRMVLRVDPVSGAQSVISSGGLLVTPFGIAVAANADIFVVDPMTEMPDGRVIRIDPVTGAQTIFAEGQKLIDPLGISIAP